MARVRLIDLPPEECARLRELGLAPDTLVQVIQCGAFKSRVIAVGSDRFAIDGRTCRCIQLYDDAATDDVAARASAEPTPKNRRKTPLVLVP